MTEKKITIVPFLENPLPVLVYLKGDTVANLVALYPIKKAPNLEALLFRQSFPIVNGI